MDNNSRKNNIGQTANKIVKSINNHLAVLMMRYNGIRQELSHCVLSVLNFGVKFLLIIANPIGHKSMKSIASASEFQ